MANGMGNNMEGIRPMGPEFINKIGTVLYGMVGVHLSPREADTLMKEVPRIVAAMRGRQINAEKMASMVAQARQQAMSQRGAVPGGPGGMPPGGPPPGGMARPGMGGVPMRTGMGMGQRPGMPPPQQQAPQLQAWDRMGIGGR